MRAAASRPGPREGAPPPTPFSAWSALDDSLPPRVALRLLLPAQCPPFDALLVPLALQDALYKDPRGVDVVGVDRPRRHELLHFRDRHPGRAGHHGCEVAGRSPEDEGAGGVPLPGLDGGEGRLG